MVGYVVTRELKRSDGRKPMCLYVYFVFIETEEELLILRIFCIFVFHIQVGMYVCFCFVSYLCTLPTHAYQYDISICLSACLLFLSGCPSVCWWLVCRWVHLSVSPSVRKYVRPSVCLAIYLWTYLYLYKNDEKECAFWSNWMIYWNIFAPSWRLCQL